MRWRGQSRICLAHVIGLKGIEKEADWGSGACLLHFPKLLVIPVSLA